MDNVWSLIFGSLGGRLAAAWRPLGVPITVRLYLMHRILALHRYLMIGNAGAAQVLVVIVWQNAFGNLIWQESCAIH